VPSQTFSKGFNDISLSFKRHPVTNDVVLLKNEDAIKRSVQNLVRIVLGEVFFDRLLGTNIEKSLFELSTVNVTDDIRSEIETTINNNEPRVQLTGIGVDITPDDNALDIKIEYSIIGMSAPSQTINFILEPNRL
tara:strand:- start:527 stop:931 length:405 start_codon:yes stop_codon:yes gene_type:complete